MSSVKDEIIAQALAQGLSNKDAYKKGYPLVTDTSAEACSTRYLDKHPEVRQRAIDIVQEASGLTLMDALNGVKEGLASTVTNKFGTFNDNTTRLEATKLLLRIHNELSDRPTIAIDNRSINICLTPEYIDRVYQVLDRFKEMRSKPSVIDGEIVRSKPKDTTD